MEMVVISLLYTALHKDWGISKLEEGLLAGVIFMGFLVGNIVGGYLGVRDCSVATFPIIESRAKHNGLQLQALVEVIDREKNVLKCFIYFHVAGDQWGRRNTLLLSGGFFLVSATLSAFAPDLITLCILRSCVGMAVGCKLPVATAILIELTPSKDRGVSTTLSYSDNAQDVRIPHTKY
jgi:MFS family permease